MHIIGNMIYLWAFGREIEDAMGAARFLFFYLAGGIVAMMAQILGDPLFAGFPASAPAAPSLPSWAHSSSRFRATAFGRCSSSSSLFESHLFLRCFLIGFWFLIQVFNVGSVATVKTGGVAYLAHVGGFLFGVVTARLFVDPNRIALRRVPTYPTY